ncbi:MAG: phage portal protein [Cetobacterium sp.]
MLGRDQGSAFRSKAGPTVGVHRALGITAWWSGVRFLSEGVSFLPVHTFRRTSAGREQRADPPWLAAPDVEQTWQGLVEHWMMSLLHTGNAYAFKLRDNVSRVSGLREIHPERVTVHVAPDNRKRFVLDHDTNRLWTTRDILHIPGLAYNGRSGLNPLRAQAESLGAVAATDDYAGRWFGSGTHLGGIISLPNPLTGTQAQDLRQEWDRFHEGITNAHKTGVLSAGATYDRITLNADDAQMLESRQYGVTEVARILRIPPHKLYDLSRATFSNIEHQSIEAVVDGIQPWVERIEAWVNADPDLIPGRQQYIEFSLEGRLRGDTATRYAAYSAAVGRPWMAPDEARSKENLPPIPGGDKVAMPLNMSGGEQDAKAKEVAA